MEIVYLISNGDLLKAKDIFELPAHEFLFYGEYLIRKRNIENQEQSLNNH